jgi:uncharacterized protein (TIGR02246 family)
VRRQLGRALPIVLIAILLPCGLAAQPPAPAVSAAAVAAPAVSSGDATLDQTIKKANTDWILAMHTGDGAKQAEPYEDDAVFVALDGSATRGRVQIESMLKQRFIDNGLAVSTKLEPQHILREGNLAVEMGVAEVHRAGANGQETVTSGSYLTVWRRQEDGSWKIHRNVILQ